MCMRERARDFTLTFKIHFIYISFTFPSSFPLQEDVATGACLPELLLSPLAALGEILQDCSPLLLSGTEGLAVIEGPPAPSELEEAGAAVHVAL